MFKSLFIIARSKKNTLFEFIILYIISLILIVSSDFILKGSVSPINTYFKFLPPLIWSLIFTIIIQIFKLTRIIVYVLFFSASLTMFLKLTNPMTGSYIESSNMFLFGLSFFSVSISYRLYHKNLRREDLLLISNPLLIISGPVITQFNKIHFVHLKRRIYIYLPYLLVGIFFFQIIAYPLQKYFKLIENTETLLVLAFGIIFEVFIYFNFAGFSLIVYALFGILGINIPLNFRQPFSSMNLIDFWRGWHISLSTVLKDLFYSPTKKNINSTIAILTVFVCSGLWHGVTLNFIIWGTFHALCFLLTKWLVNLKYNYFSTVLMIIAIPIGRCIFADNDTYRLMSKLDVTLELPEGKYGLGLEWQNFISLAIGLIIIFLEFIFQSKKLFRQRNYKFLRTPLMQIIILILILLLIYENNGVNYAAYGQR